jgi:hypothetical protein
VKVASVAFAAMMVLPSVLPVAAQQPPAETVQSLIGKGYAVVSSFASQVGPGIFLQKADSLYLCFASETPNSTDVKTQYCKPVH